MKKESEVELLKQEIRRMEIKQTSELEVIKSQLLISYESLRPINLLKNTISDIIASPKIKDGLINNAFGMTGGYLARMLLFGTSHNPIRKLAGMVSGSAISYWLTNNTGSLKTIGENVFYKILKSWKPSKNSINSNSI